MISFRIYSEEFLDKDEKQMIMDDIEQILQSNYLENYEIEKDKDIFLLKISRLVL